MPQLGSCASSGRAWRLWAARHSQGETGPLGAQPLPRVLDLAASKAADSTACVVPSSRLGKNPNVDTSMLPDADRQATLTLTLTRT